MKRSLRTKLTFSYIAVALLLVAVLAIVTNLLVENQFRSYITKQLEIRNKELVALLNQQYNPEKKAWDKTGVENIGVNALEQGLIVKVFDASGQKVWDATEHNHGLCNQMMNKMAMNMMSRYPNFQGGYRESPYNLMQGLSQVGKVEIGYYGPFYLTDNDLAFINALNKWLAITTVIALIIALALGTYMAKRLSTPIGSVIQSARRISRGDYKARITEHSDTTEIGELTQTFNELAETLDTQENLKKRLTADVAHELRTPLATLQSHMEAMIDGIWVADKERLQSCHEEILRINRMVGDLERLTRFEGENLVLQKETFDMSAVISGIIRNFEPEYRNKNVALIFEPVSVRVTGDRDKLSQVVVNLLSNALKYTPETGTVWV
ncbi:MAG: HAMP domain-containing protein, partial [Clostridia bacterium]|nr:HAMP domain-containing protein [Clostridia bacterium]